jgi:hypothetical protein
VSGVPSKPARPAEVEFLAVESEAAVRKRGVMESTFWCLDCGAARELDLHGRCSCCQSDAICVAAPGPCGTEIRTEIVVTDSEVIERVIETVRVR